MLSKIALQVLLGMCSVVHEDSPTLKCTMYSAVVVSSALLQGCLAASHRILYPVSCVQTVLCLSCSNVVSTNAALSLRICLKLENVCLEFCDWEVQLVLAVSLPYVRPNMTMYLPLVFSTHWTCPASLKNHYV